MQYSFNYSKDLKNSLKVIDILSVKNICILINKKRKILKPMNHNISDVG